MIRQSCWLSYRSTASRPSCRDIDGTTNGRPWAVMQINHDDRRVVVVPSPIGRQPTWDGFLPQFLGKEICQQILCVTTSSDSDANLEPDSLAVLQEQRDTLGRLLHPTRGAIDRDASRRRPRYSKKTAWSVRHGHPTVLPAPRGLGFRFCCSGFLLISLENDLFRPGLRT